MFYLLKRKDEKQFTPGERVMLLADFSGVAAGTIGKITEVYEGGVMVEWQSYGVHDLVAGAESLKRKPLADGFGRDELEYLAVETEKHPGHAFRKEDDSLKV